MQTVSVVSVSCLNLLHLLPNSGPATAVDCCGLLWTMWTAVCPSSMDGLSLRGPR